MLYINDSLYRLKHTYHNNKKVFFFYVLSLFNIIQMPMMSKLYIILQSFLLV